jgi:flavin reductase (DIM6/NTAB) family NADH-FMN oxidoreductase RutF
MTEAPYPHLRPPNAALRRTLGTFATGVTVVTTRGSAGDYAMTVNAFTSVSLEPRLILVCLNKDARGKSALLRNGVFAVNVLSAEQEALSQRFARRSRPRDADTFAGIETAAAQTGSPIMAEAAAYLDCEIATVHTAGDHVIVLGEVVASGCDAHRSPLVFHGGHYGTFAKDRVVDPCTCRLPVVPLAGRSRIP